jgi:hypothetical protein
MTELLVLAAAGALAGFYVSWTAGRLDRLHARVDASWAALDAALVRRAAAARAVAGQLEDPRAGAALAAAASAALEAAPVERERVESDLSRALKASVSMVVHDAPGDAAMAELRTAATRVGLARSFHDTAVEDTRAIRLRRLPRALRLAGRRALPEPFEFDDTVL